MNNLESVLAEINKLEERFLEAGEAKEDLPNSTPVETKEEQEEVLLYSQLVLNSVHSAVNLVKMMLDESHQGSLIDLIGESGISQVKQYSAQLEEMHEFFDDILSEEPSESSEEESEEELEEEPEEEAEEESDEESDESSEEEPEEESEDLEDEESEEEDESAV
jgi:hypothetical protein